MKVKFNDLPIEIKGEMLAEQLRQGNPVDVNVFYENITANSNIGGFNWDYSLKGRDYWEANINKKSDSFNELIDFLNNLNIK